MITYLLAHILPDLLTYDLDRLPQARSLLPPLVRWMRSTSADFGGLFAEPIGRMASSALGALCAEPSRARALLVPATPGSQSLIESVLVR